LLVYVTPRPVPENKTDRYRKTNGLGLRIGERQEYRDPSF
jgi:hypothetical protein